MVSCAQEMLFVKNLVECVGLVVKLPMIMFGDNKGAIYLANNWSIGGKARHVDVRQLFLHDLKELKVLLCMWKRSSTMCADMFTKTLDTTTFIVHLPCFVTEWSMSSIDNIDQGRMLARVICFYILLIRFEAQPRLCCRLHLTMNVLHRY